MHEDKFSYSYCNHILSKTAIFFSYVSFIIEFVRIEFSKTIFSSELALWRPKFGLKVQIVNNLNRNCIALKVTCSIRYINDIIKINKKLNKRKLLNEKLKGAQNFKIKLEKENKTES